MQKKILYNIMILLLAAICFPACSDDDNKDVGDVLKLQASSAVILLDEAKADDIAVSFTWNKGKDRGPENTIVYIFRLDIFGADFKTSTDPIEFPSDGEFKVEYTHKELNDLIINKWQYEQGAEIKLEARVVAKVSGPKFVYPEISVIPLEVKSYVSTPKNLMAEDNY